MSKKRSKNAAADREVVNAQLLDYEVIKERCGAVAGDAYMANRDRGLTLDEFADADFDCRKCPRFMQCSLADRFHGHPTWRFKWLEESTTGPEA